jgi:hypothetical protein
MIVRIRRESRRFAMVDMSVTSSVIKRGMMRAPLDLAALSYRIEKAASGRGSVSHLE